MNIHNVYGKVLPHFRKRRMAFFEALFKPTDSTKILDVGGTEFNWSFLNAKPQITLLNIDLKEIEKKGSITKMPGDGRQLPFADQSFDIVYSNSVIEHVGTKADQEAFAKEIQRVGKKFFVQTPNRRFPVEPHLIAPFIHYLPRKAQDKLARYFTVWGLLTKPKPADVQSMLDSILLLSTKEFVGLFPKAKIRQERMLGLSRSLIAYKD